MQRARFHSLIPVPIEELFDWHAQPGAFERLAPPWQTVRVTHRSGTIQDGDVLEMALSFGPFSAGWVALHSDYIHGRQFWDTQVKGPFQVWVHSHRFTSHGESSSILDDEVTLQLPLASLVGPPLAALVHGELRRMFRYRHLRTRLDLWRHRQYRDAPRLTVAVLGEHPLAGQVRAFLSGGGHHVVSPATAPALIDLRTLNRPGSGNGDSFAARTVIRVMPEAAYIGDQAAAERDVRIIVPGTVVGGSFGGGSPALLARETLASRRTARDQKRWISEDDLIGLTYHALMRDFRDGTFEAVAGSRHLPRDFRFAFTSRAAAGAAITGRL